MLAFKSRKNFENKSCAQAAILENGGKNMVVFNIEKHGCFSCPTLKKNYQTLVGTIEFSSKKQTI
jgi:hypothetical protein